MNQEGELFLNLTEIAERWGISVGGVLRSHVGSGRLKTRRDGRSHLVSVGDLAKYEQRISADIARRIDDDRQRLLRLQAPFPSAPVKAK